MFTKPAMLVRSFACGVLKMGISTVLSGVVLYRSKQHPHQQCSHAGDCQSDSVKSHELKDGEPWIHGRVSDDRDLNYAGDHN